MKTYSVLAAIVASNFVNQVIALPAPAAYTLAKRDDLTVEQDLVTILVKKSDLEDRGLVSSSRPSFILQKLTNL